MENRVTDNVVPFIKEICCFNVVYQYKNETEFCFLFSYRENIMCPLKCKSFPPFRVIFDRDGILKFNNYLTASMLGELPKVEGETHMQAEILRFEGKKDDDKR